VARPKKNIEPILGAGKDPENKLTVQKSTPLFSLWRSDMSLAEFKILDTYLSRINSHDPEKRTVVFTKGELEQLLGVKKINKADLSDRLNGLGRFVELQHADNKIHKVALFEEAYGEMDENGLWTIKLTCTAKAMKYIFNVEKLGYLRYKLRCITSLSSRYAYILFMYLESNRFRKTWDVKLDELRSLLNCTDELYSEYKYFNQRILQRSQKELHDKSECRFSYVPIRVGRKVTAIRFTLETLADSIEPQIPGQVQLDAFGDLDDPNGIYAEALPPEFTPEQVEVLRLLAVERVPYDISGPLPMECKIADYLALQVAKMNASHRPVAHKYEYLKAMIENDD
jgi:hypothetical protein